VEAEILNISRQRHTQANPARVCQEMRICAEKSLPGLDISSISALYFLLKIHSSHVLTCAVAQKPQRALFVNQPRGNLKKKNNEKTLHTVKSKK